MKKTKQSRKCWREGGKEREEDECQRVILELACFPGRRKTQRRSKPQSDKRSQPTNERPNKRTKEQIDFSLLHHRCGFYLTGDVIIISPCVRRDFSPSADQTEGGGVSGGGGSAEDIWLHIITVTPRLHHLSTVYDNNECLPPSLSGV